MQEHFIELSNRYSIKVSDAGKYIIYKIELQENGTYERVGGKVCKDLFKVVDTLILCELMGDDINALSDVAKKLEEIYVEVKRITEIQATYVQA